MNRKFLLTDVFHYMSCILYNKAVFDDSHRRVYKNDYLNHRYERYEREYNEKYDKWYAEDYNNKRVQGK